MTRLRQLWLLTALGSLAVLAGGYFLLVTPQSNKAADIRAEAETQQDVNRQLQSQIDMLKKQRKDLPAQQEKLARFARLIPPNPAIPALTRSLTDAADNSGVELVALNPTLPEYSKGRDLKTRAELPGRVPAPDGRVLVNIPLQLEIVGSYSQITQFFTEIEELNRALLVDGFTVEAGNVKSRKVAGVAADSAADPELLRAELKVLVMMTKKPATSAAPTTTTTKTTTTSSTTTK